MEPSKVCHTYDVRHGAILYNYEMTPYFEMRLNLPIVPQKACIDRITVVDPTADKYVGRREQVPDFNQITET